MTEPLEPRTAKALAVAALGRAGAVLFDDHVRARMRDRRVSSLDVSRVIRGGTPQHGEWKDGTWRYALRTETITVVIAFRRLDKDHPVISIVTVLRHRG